MVRKLLLLLPLIGLSVVAVVTPADAPSLVDYRRVPQRASNKFVDGTYVSKHAAPRLSSYADGPPNRRFGLVFYVTKPSLAGYGLPGTQ
jgi:hypothetical protein